MTGPTTYAWARFINRGSQAPHMGNTTACQKNVATWTDTYGYIQWFMFFFYVVPLSSTRNCVWIIYIYTWNLVGCKISVLIRNDKNLFHVRGEMSLSSEIVISLWPQVRPLPSLWLIVFQRAIRTPQIFANILTCTGIPGAWSNTNPESGAFFLSCSNMLTILTTFLDMRAQLHHVRPDP